MTGGEFSLVGAAGRTAAHAVGAQSRRPVLIPAVKCPFSSLRAERPSRYCLRAARPLRSRTRARSLRPCRRALPCRARQLRFAGRRSKPLAAPLLATSVTRTVRCGAWLRHRELGNLIELRLQQIPPAGGVERRCRGVFAFFGCRLGAADELRTGRSRGAHSGCGQPVARADSARQHRQPAAPSTTARTRRTRAASRASRAALRAPEWRTAACSGSA